MKVFDIFFRFKLPIKNYVIIVVLSTMIMACSAPQAQNSYGGFTINEIVIRNSSYNTIKDATLKVEKFNQIFSCGTILAQSECSTSFPSRPYHGNLVSMRWTQNGVSLKSSPFKIIPGKNLKSTEVLKGVIQISTQGTFEAFLLQQ